MSKRTHQIKKYALVAVLFFAILILLGVVFFAYFYKELSPQTDIAVLRKDFTSNLTSRNPTEVYADFKETYSHKPFFVQHAIAHLFGDSLYEALGASGIHVCDADFNFGCFHGLLSKAIRTEGLQAVPSLDDACFDESLVTKSSQCQHGIGHGILEFLGTENLAGAIEACGSTRPANPLAGCMSGVFMEYNAPLVTDEENFYLAPPAFYDPDRPYAPCTDFSDPTVQLSCYHEIPQRWQYTYQDDYRTIGALCAGLEKMQQRQVCFSGLGFIVPASNEYSAEQTVASCNLIEDLEGKKTCLMHAAWAFESIARDRGGKETVLNAYLSLKENQ
jgi:hypothetical protein